MKQIAAWRSKGSLATKKAIQAILDEDARLEEMLRYEKILYNNGINYIAGIDEVGRGPLAGPVVVAKKLFCQKIVK